LTGQPPVTSEEPIELLLLDAGILVAKEQITTLRNAGFRIRPRIASSLHKFLYTIRHEPPEILICNCDPVEFGVRQVLTAIAEHRPGLPTLLIDPPRDGESAQLALQLGARDLLPLGDGELLTIAFRRECDSLSQRRQAKQLQQQLDATEQRYNTLFGNSREAIAYIRNGVHLRANPAYLSLFGFMDGTDLTGVPLLELIAQREQQAAQLLLRIADNEASGEVELLCHTQTHQSFEAGIGFSPAQDNGKACTQLVVRNLSLARELDQRVRLLSDQDQETGLDNRRQFINHLDSLIPGFQQGKSGALLYVSISNMEEIRGKAGPEQAGRLLVDFGARLRRAADEIDLVGRLGDHTFCLLCPQQDLGATGRVAERICNGPGSQVAADSPGGLPLRVNIGIAYAGPSLKSAEEFVEQAFLACEAARQQGPNCWLRFDSTLADTFSKRRIDEHDRIISLIDDALANDRFRLLYQPVVSLRGDSRENYSVLVRMLSQDNDTLLPESFLDYAKSHGRMASIDRWVIHHAIAELAHQRKGNRKINLFINLSAAALKQNDLLIWICDCLRQFDARGSWLTFQIADKDIRTNVHSTHNLLQGLKRISCRFAVNHFGVIAKHENLLKHLPVDFVKLDPGFVDHLASEPKQQQQLEALCRLARQYGVQTIVAGVEDHDCLCHLWDVGADYVEGYLLHEPVADIGYAFNLD
jgi:multidomain signaling protein FimX